MNIYIVTFVDDYDDFIHVETKSFKNLQEAEKCFRDFTDQVCDQVFDSEMDTMTDEEIEDGRVAFRMSYTIENVFRFNKEEYNEKFCVKLEQQTID